MATTFELIASQTLGSDTASVTFSSIPGTFDDLVLEFSARSARAVGLYTDSLKVNFNGVSTGYSERYLYSFNISVVTSGAGTDAAFVVGSVASNDATANTFGSGQLYIPNYAGSTYKSTSGYGASENNSGYNYMGFTAGLWSNTAAITSMALTAVTANNWKSGSSFYLYGVTHA